jgi:hypothetical protein
MVQTRTLCVKQWRKECGTREGRVKGPHPSRDGKDGPPSKARTTAEARTTAKANPTATANGPPEGGRYVDLFGRSSTALTDWRHRG